MASQQLTLDAEPRTLLGKKVKQIRRAGKVPAVVYMNGAESRHITVDAHEFEQVSRHGGTTGLVELKIGEDTPMHVICRHVEHDAISGQVMHVELLRVSMTERIIMEIPVRYHGEPGAVRTLQGSLITHRDHVRVEGLPGDMIHRIDVDVSGLDTFEDHILVGDLKLPEGLVAADPADELLASVAPPAKEEEEVAPVAEEGEAEAAPAEEAEE